MEIAGIVIATRCRNVVDEDLFVAGIATPVDCESGDTVSTIRSATVGALFVRVIEIDEAIPGPEIGVYRHAEQTRLAAGAGDRGQIECHCGGGGVLTVERTALRGNEDRSVGQPVNRGWTGHIVDNQAIAKASIRERRGRRIGGQEETNRNNEANNGGQRAADLLHESSVTRTLIQMRA